MISDGETMSFFVDASDEFGDMRLGRKRFFDDVAAFQID